ncbi:MAG TPA: diguanylate cyclase [Polyangiaceae bacterium]|nr:diguanylate cyclase [Polyangiaceae bacterium]
MRLKSSVVPTGRTIMVIDDSEEYLRSTVRILEREGHEVVAASSGREALDLVRTRPVDLVLVDYFMPGMTGEEFVRELRIFDPHVQVILQTGYASERPSREMLKRLDIQGYHDKSEGPEKQLLWVDVGLRAAFTVQLLCKSRAGLTYILNATPELHKIQPLEDLLQGILMQTVGLLGATNSILVVAPTPVQESTPEGFVAMAQPGGPLSVRAATGKFVGCQALAGALTPAQLTTVSESLQRSGAQALGDATMVPLCVGDATLGLIYVDRPIVDPRDLALLEVFANQAAVAIRNVSLYEIAAFDELTRTHTRRYFEEMMIRELRRSLRYGHGVGLLVVDIDAMKHINDIGGHLCGDEALSRVGTLLRKSVRATDVVGRYGGDEFVVLLPDVDADGVELVMRRIVEAAKDLYATAADGSSMPVRVTVGAALLGQEVANQQSRARPQEFFQGVARHLISAADANMYRGKRAGKGRAGGVAAEVWPAA